MKSIISILPFLLICNLLNAQNSINYINYKKACNKAYISALKDSNYQQSIDQLNKVYDTYHFLAAEEYMLKAYAYKQLDSSLLCAENVKLTWSNYAVDFSYLFEIPELMPTRIIENFNENELALMNEGYDNFSKLKKHPSSDSVLAKLESMNEKDRMVRDSMTADKSPAILSATKKVDSLNGIEFKQIILSYGFPGERFAPGRSSTSFGLILHLADYPEYFEEMNPILLTEVRNGRMSTTYYLYWLDRHIFTTSGKSLYGMYAPPGTKLDKTSKILKRRLKYGMNYGFPVPPKTLVYSTTE